jgi:hypothetical protein
MQTRNKPEVEMPEWDKSAVSYMKGRAKDPDKLGLQLKPGHPADEWERYFLSKKMGNKAAFLRHQMRTGGTYTVPTLFPDQYDPTFTRGIYRPAPKPEPQREAVNRMRINDLFKKLRHELGGVPIRHDQPTADQIKAKAQAWLADLEKRGPETPPTLSERARKLIRKPKDGDL